MAFDPELVYCRKCGQVLSELPNLGMGKRKPCLKCGSKLRTYKINFSEIVRFKEKLKKKINGRKAFSEQVTGESIQKKSGKWMKVKRIIDRKNDFYSEEVVDPSTGKIIHKCEEPLSKHKGHGLAQNK